MNNGNNQPLSDVCKYNGNNQPLSDVCKYRDGWRNRLAEYRVIRKIIAQPVYVPDDEFSVVGG